MRNKSAMSDVRIGSLRLEIANAAGHEHRIAPIAGRAAAILGSRLDQRLANLKQRGTQGYEIENLTASPLDLNLATMSNEHAAGAIASAWLEAVALKLKL